MVFLHDASLYLLYVALGLAVFLAIERTIFYTHANRQIKSLLQALKTKSPLPELKQAMWARLWRMHLQMDFTQRPPKKWPTMLLNRHSYVSNIN